ncbi:MAG: phosphoribosyl-ATP diphosphatase [Sulfurovum sp. PC08-66]|nr:MAG: phosphoribosyl-ATP diphosphatase [Sulfurovum sp. PC08-66]KIM12560.1 MAG: phosphoribosyl-ATP diphosphatase [Sulfuricurvum sp. PC08-66]
MNNIDRIDWEKCNHLLPVIVQDSHTLAVLMHAYMNREALELSLSTGYAHYFSRTKQRIWKKGETSGHTQKINTFLLDCDNDTLLLQVDQLGVACHTGRESCFFTDFSTMQTTMEVAIDTTQTYGVVEQLYHTILEKKKADPSTSYTAQLLSKGQNGYLKKVIEEAGEFTFAVKDNNTKEMVYEAADLLYHTLVAMADKGVAPDLVRQELARRFGMGGLEEKAARKK